MPAKAIKKEDINRLIIQLQRIVDKCDTDKNPWVIVGFARQGAETLIKQLKGEYPIL